MTKTDLKASNSVAEEPAEHADTMPALARRKGQNLICQILLRHGDVTSANVRKALKAQEEKGGQIGRILVAMGACSERAISRALLEQVRLRDDMDQANLSQLARDNPAIAGLEVSCSPFRTTLTLLLSDVFSLLASFIIAFSFSNLRAAYTNSLILLIGATTLSMLAFVGAGLYAAMAHSPPDELRITSGAVTSALIGIATVGLLADKVERLWTIAALLIWWVSALFIVPTLRAIVRGKASRTRWWGHPVVVLGAAKTGRLVVRTLRAQPERGLVPVLLLDDDQSKHGTLRASLHDEQLEVRSVAMEASDLVRGSTIAMASDFFGTDDDDLPPPSLYSSRPSSDRDSDAPRPSVFMKAPGMFAEVDGVPIVGDLSVAATLAKRLKIDYVILAMPGLASDKLLRITERVGGAFSHLLVIPDLFGLGSIGVPAKDVGGILGIEVRQQLLLPGPRFAKRAMDVALTSLGGICILPILILLTLAIVIDSRGGAFYKQKRLGRDGKQFFAHKFRSMHGDGEARLKAILEADPKLREEYEVYHKLRNDPRVTRVGRIIRKYSLDELPQLWNVIVGDMSLVGPRPYLEREIKDMEGQEGFILRAWPGMTGLWQVSDRNAIGFSGRVRMDVHYVRNWSPWIDIYILARTFGVVIKGTGM